MTAYKTIVTHVGQHPEPTVDHLLDVLAEHPLDRRFEDLGDFLEPPAWCDNDWPEHWARDGSDGEQMAWGNFWGLSCVFRICTNDPAVIAQLRVAIDANKARPDYQSQPAPAMSLVLLRGYLDDLWLAGPLHEWSRMPERCVELAPLHGDDARTLATLRWDGLTWQYDVDRRKLKTVLIDLVRTRRPALGFTVEDIMGPLCGSKPGTLAHALVTGAA